MCLVGILFSRFINFVTNEIRQVIVYYFAFKFQKFTGDCESTWKQINNIIRSNRINKRKFINKINENDISYETKHDIGNVLNSHFVHIGKHISESTLEGPFDHCQYFKVNYDNSIFFASVSSADVEEIIFSLRNKPGCHIINLSLSTGIFLDCLKLALWLESHTKGGDSTNAGNYRPTDL